MLRRLSLCRSASTEMSWPRAIPACLLSALRPLGPQPSRQPVDDVERGAYFRLLGLGRSILLRVAVDPPPLAPTMSRGDEFGGIRETRLRQRPELLQRMRLPAAPAGERQKAFQQFLDRLLAMKGGAVIQRRIARHAGEGHL